MGTTWKREPVSKRTSFHGQCDGTREKLRQNAMMTMTKTKNQKTRMTTRTTILMTNLQKGRRAERRVRRKRDQRSHQRQVRRSLPNLDQPMETRRNANSSKQSTHYSERLVFILSVVSRRDGAAA